MRKASLLCQEEEYSYHADWESMPKWPCTNQPTKITLIGNSPVVLVVHALTSRLWVQSLVRELKSHKPSSMALKKQRLLGK